MATGLCTYASKATSSAFIGEIERSGYETYLWLYLWLRPAKVHSHGLVLNTLYWKQLSYDHVLNSLIMTHGHVIAFSTPTCLGHSTGLVFSVTAPSCWDFLSFFLHQPKWLKLPTRKPGPEWPVWPCWWLLKYKMLANSFFFSFCQELGGLIEDVSLATVLQV